MSHRSTSPRFSTITHRISLTLSSLCVLHCLALPFVILFLPALSGFFSETMEHILILSVIPVSAVGFIPVWMRHKNKMLLSAYVSGLVLLVVGQFVFHPSHGEQHVFTASLLESIPGILLVFTGATLLAWSTWKNRQHTHVCKNPHHNHIHIH